MHWQHANVHKRPDFLIALVQLAALYYAATANSMLGAHLAQLLQPPATAVVHSSLARGITFMPSTSTIIAIHSLTFGIYFTFAVPNGNFQLIRSRLYDIVIVKTRLN